MNSCLVRMVGSGTRRGGICYHRQSLRCPEGELKESTRHITISCGLSDRLMD